ncbi:Double-strand break repair protein MRE11 [Eufriesea mexicana]|nr:Double-strand break repair protein MRE11 [Eufriesea mexicana]
MSSKKDNNADEDTSNIVKILIATDIHLGFEYNKKRGQESDDSFTTFEEILQYGKEYEVDFILLGGDLFHDTKPSQTTILKCMELLRKYCLGSSDPEVVFNHCTYKTVNYEDPNLNVDMPVFSIHGNHDDPMSGLINYFGKWTDLTQITIPPLILKKGETHIALYGLSYINDQRLSRLFRDFKNRSPYSEYGYIPQHKLPSFLNFIIWGHEHECRITPEFIPEAEYFISQPGSSIATSLCESEAKPKYIGILSVNKSKFKITKLKLQTVRPFVFNNLVIQDEEIPKNYTEQLSESVYNFVDNYIQNVIMPQAATLLSGHPKQPILPLIRLRIFYSCDEEILAQKYCDEIANPMDMIIFRKQKILNKQSKSNNPNFSDDLQNMAQILCYDDDDRNWNKTVQGGVKKYFSLKENKDKLTVLTVNGLNEALNRFVDRGDTDAFKDIVNHQMKKTIAHLETCDIDTTESICNAIRNFRDIRMEDEQEDIMMSDMDENEDEERNMSRPKRGRGTGQGSRGTGRGRAKLKTKISPGPSTPALTKVLHVKKSRKKQDQNYMGSSYKTKQSGANDIILEDSD